MDFFGKFVGDFWGILEAEGRYWIVSLLATCCC